MTRAFRGKPSPRQSVGPEPNVSGVFGDPIHEHSVTRHHCRRPTHRIILRLHVRLVDETGRLPPGGRGVGHMHRIVGDHLQ